jgi:hypothetical protein
LILVKSTSKGLGNTTPPKLASHHFLVRNRNGWLDLCQACLCSKEEWADCSKYFSHMQTDILGSEIKRRRKKKE